MKRPLLLMSLLVLPALAAFTFTKPVAVYAEGDSESEEVLNVSEEAEEPAEVEADFNIEDYIDKIKNTQFLGTTLGAIAASAVSLLVSLGFSLLNKHNINKATEFTSTTRGYVIDVKSSEDASAKRFGEMKDAITDLVQKLTDVNKALEEQSKANQALRDFLKEEADRHQEEIYLLLSLIGSNKEMVSNGTAQEILRRYGL